MVLFAGTLLLNAGGIRDKNVLGYSECVVGNTGKDDAFFSTCRVGICKPVDREYGLVNYHS